MEYQYWLPDEQGEKKDYVTTNNAVIIIGANGSGKSKLGAWIEQRGFDKVHRIGAQRNLNFNENISLKSYSQAENLVFYGSDNKDAHKGNRWNWGKYTTQMLNDFENVLAALIALKNNENDNYIEKCKEAEARNATKPATPTTVIDNLKNIWNNVFPQRNLILEDSKFFAVFTDQNGEHKYSATQMSDGERSVLYLAAQVLCVPKEKILIMDEPELHLHRSIMHRLWMALENCRKDCLFIYITHDTEFAAQHISAEKIWIQEYDGQNWKFSKIENEYLPESLLLNILGSRQNVLFVEGENNSYDTQLYSLLYPNYHIIACGSCSQVISRTKAFTLSNNLHHCKVYGIIDRDFRSEYEIKKYEDENIFVIDVAEVENLFLVEEIIRFLAKHLGKDDNKLFEDISRYVIDERFSKQIDGQICQSTVAEIKYNLSSFNVSKKNDIEAQRSLDEIWNAVDYEMIKKKHEEKFRSILQKRNYKDILKIFNEKNIVKTIGHYFGINNNEFCKIIVALAKGEKHDAITSALSLYLPEGIQK